MGNKNGGALKAANIGGPGKEDGGETITGILSRDGEPSPGAQLLAELQALGDNADYTLLPHSLHQIAEAYSAKEDYQAAIQFLQLEKLYHERLLSNLAALQRSWESQRPQSQSQNQGPPHADADAVSQTHMETLRHICRTHLKPSINVEQNTANAPVQGALNNEESALLGHPGGHQQQQEEEEEEEEEDHEEEEEEDEEGERGPYEEGQEVEEEELCEETPEDEEVKLEWPTGVAQASDKDLAKLSHKEGSSSPDGLVSILKRRRASLDGLPPPSDLDTKHNSKRKVRFSEPDDGGEQDEVGGDSCLILLLLCLVTVVISVGGTALYCTLVDTYSNVCADFSLNVDFYLQSVRRFLEGLRHWLPLQT